MTDSFEFKEPQIGMTLCGKEFSVTAGEETAKICSDILCEAKSRLAQLRGGGTDASVSEDGICSFLKQSIERLIGIGAVDKIFDTRCQEVTAMAELMCYIASKIKAAYLMQKD